MKEIDALVAQLPDPGAATARVRAALQAFFAPPRVAARPEEVELMQRAQRRDFDVDGQRVAAWRWGDGPCVLLVHGWGSRGSHLAAFVAPLLGHGLSVAAYDAPAHGDSPGTLSSVVHAGRAVRAAARALGPVHGIVAHSMGSPASLYAFRDGLRVAASVHLAGPATLANVMHGYARVFGLAGDEGAAFRIAIERFIGEPVAAGAVEALAAGLAHPGLVIHDRDDREVACSESEALARHWPAATLWLTEGLGHRRLLGSAEVAARAACFFAAGVTRRERAQACSRS